MVAPKVRAVAVNVYVAHCGSTDIMPVTPFPKFNVVYTPRGLGTIGMSAW